MDGMLISGAWQWKCRRVLAKVSSHEDRRIFGHV